MATETILKAIAAHIGEKEVLSQMKEEAAELIVAANKTRRASDGLNPTPISREEAEEMILEEMADLSNCVMALGLNTPMNLLKIKGMMYQKAQRWAERVGATIENPCETDLNVEEKGK